MMNFAGCHGIFGGMMGGGMFFYGFIFLLIIAVIIYLISHKNQTNQPEALKILDSEYAKGNISDEDYKKRKENLLN
jgi:putative membrane protein